MDWLSLSIALCAGVSLSAACGFRVFVPLLTLAIAVRFCGYSVNEHLAWVGSDTAFYGLLVATVLEIAAYYIPAVDNLLDAVSTPLALVAGAIVTAGLMPDMPDIVQWAIGIIVGSGAAGAVQASTVATRGASTVTTGGFGNALVASAENVFSVAGSLLAIVLPMLAIIGVLFLAWLLWCVLRRFRKRRQEQPAT